MVSRLQTREEDVWTRDIQTYSLNFPGVLRDRQRAGGTWLYLSDIYRCEPELAGFTGC